MNVMIISADKAEELMAEGFPKNSAVISFKGDDGYLRYDTPEADVFYVDAEDLSYAELKEEGKTNEYFTECDEAAVFLKESVAEGKNIICQCEYGQGRSAGCAAAILEYYEGNGISIFANYDYTPNQVVFNMMLDSLRKTDGN